MGKEILEIVKSICAILFLARMRLVPCRQNLTPQSGYSGGSFRLTVRNQMKKIAWIPTSLLFLLISSFHMVMSVQAVTIYDSPYARFVPDEQAFTTNAGDKNYKWYDNGITVNTGKTSSLRALEVGEHYYKASRSGSIPISKWEVSFRTGTDTSFLL